MAKVKGPLFSIDARGQIAKAMVFGGWKGIPWVREWFIPQNPSSDDQKAIRKIFTQAVDAWHYTVSGPQRILWQTAIDAKGIAQSGFNYHQSEYINSMRAGEVPAVTPPTY